MFPGPRRIFASFADMIKTAGMESFQTETPDGKNALNYAVRKPLGVVGIITPWNLPLLLLDVESRARSGLRKYRGCEAVRRNSGHSNTAGGSDASRPAFRMAFITLCTASVRTRPENFSRNIPT